MIDYIHRAHRIGLILLEAGLPQPSVTHLEARQLVNLYWVDGEKWFHLDVRATSLDYFIGVTDNESEGTTHEDDIIRLFKWWSSM